MVSKIAPAVSTAKQRANAPSSLFERSSWIYALLREHVFRDDSALIARSLWPVGPPSNTTVIELGCGPGFYARRLADHFPHIRVLGIDHSRPLIERAQRCATKQHLSNCRFEEADALNLPLPVHSIDALIVARLCTVIDDPERLLEEIHRVLRPGGRCFIAEPKPHPFAVLPLRILWSAVRLSDRMDGRIATYREPKMPRLLPEVEFNLLMHSQTWARIDRWSDHRYNYAVCEKQSEMSAASHKAHGHKKSRQDSSVVPGKLYA
jgi:ubiquinone/menaquinone biosynthesis C-methylase UbiE